MPSVNAPCTPHRALDEEVDMTQVSTVGAVTPAAPQPVAAPLASVADKPFAYVLHGLIGAQLARSSAQPAPAEAPPVLPAVPTGEVTVGPNGPTTVTAFRFWHRVLPIGADA
jgi:hypothetical protein